MAKDPDECEFCRNPGEYHHRIVALEKNLCKLDAKMQQDLNAIDAKVDKFMFLLFGTFTASVTAAIGAILTIAILW